MALSFINSRTSKSVSLFICEDNTCDTNSTIGCAAIKACDHVLVRTEK